jgi:1,4-dihydroxy-2-naphthoate octaprenyltransferase
MLKYWFLAIRPKTLIASILPITAGFLLAQQKSDEVSLLVATLCLVYCLLVQVATNLANDYFDHQKGGDDIRELGPDRMVSSGRLKPKSVLTVACFILLLSFFVGLAILKIVEGSPWLIMVGVVSVICALVYTGGPFPLAYNALGDVFVVLFFGVVAVEVTHLVLCNSVGVIWESNFILSVGVGLLINNLLVVNNYRDYHEDKIVGKRTSIVVFGRNFGSILFLLSLFFVFILTPILEPSAWATTFLFAFGLFLWLKLRKALTSKDFNLVLTGSALLILLQTILLVFGFCPWG